MVTENERKGIFCRSAGLGDAFVAVHQQMLSGPKGHCRLGEDILIISFLQPGIEGRGQGIAYIPGWRFLAGPALWPLVLHDLHNAVTVRNVLVDGKLVVCPDADDQSDRHAGAKTEDVDKGVAAVPAQLAEGEKEIVFEHALSLKIQLSTRQKSAYFLHLNNQLVPINLIL